MLYTCLCNAQYRDYLWMQRCVHFNVAHRHSLTYYLSANLRVHSTSDVSRVGLRNKILDVDGLCLDRPGMKDIDVHCICTYDLALTFIALRVTQLAECLHFDLTDTFTR